MPAISRIQIANFLTEGYGHGREWAPLYRGETFRLFGQPTAMQIDNGGGKTSLTEACLYLLTQNRRLKPRVEDRVSPIENGWTHVRIEFVEKVIDENVLQIDLITVDPQDIPGVTYVVGMCWSRTKDPHFYIYQGTLDDAPVFTVEPSGLTLVANDVFRKSVDRMPGSKWNKWSNHDQWLDDIRQFTNVDVLLQNVEFQLEGAGDYSAMINKVKQHPGELYDTAFFRQFVAPELLKHVMGAEADQDEQTFEDTILKTLKPAADALLDINRKQQELEQTKDALQKFQPVLDKAGEVRLADANYQHGMDAIARAAAIVHGLAVIDPPPGIPRIPPGTQWADDKRVVTALRHIYITKRDGVVVSDEGLAALVSGETRRINERAGEMKFTPILLDTEETIELAADLKRCAQIRAVVEQPDDEAQPIDNKADLKQKRGGRRYDTKCYGFNNALALVEAFSNIGGARPAGLPDILLRAFGIAEGEIDTNPYRKYLRQLGRERNEAVSRQKAAQERQALHQADLNRLTRETREAKENEIAYQGFMTRKLEFPEQFWAEPLAAQDWARNEDTTADHAHKEHIRLTGERTAAYDLWCALKEAHQSEPLSEILTNLIRTRKDAEEAARRTRDTLSKAQADLRTGQNALTAERSKREQAKERFSQLDRLSEMMPAFRAIFADADPSTLDPQRAKEFALNDKNGNNLAMQAAEQERKNLDRLVPLVARFTEVFRDADPDKLSPARDLQKHMEDIGLEQTIIDEHGPLVDALNYFLDLHPDETPDEWLRQAADQRVSYTEEVLANRAKTGELKDELADLAAFGAADDRVYAKALSVLAEQGIAFNRLHEAVSRDVDGDRLQQLLTLFSAALSAPVISTLESAAEAARLLESARLTVPIFFGPALADYIAHGAIHHDGKTAHALWVGRRTRQVDILLNPALIEDEKRQINEQLDVLDARSKELAHLVASIAEDSEAVTNAIAAQSAMRRASRKAYDEASRRRDELDKSTHDKEYRASQEAQEMISTAKRYRAAGGDARRGELADNVIPSLETARSQIDVRLRELQTQTTEAALRALHSAKDFQSAGGDDALQTAKSLFDTLSESAQALHDALETEQERVDSDLTGAANSAADVLRRIDETYSRDTDQLEKSVAFEQHGFADFMKGASEREEILAANAATAARRLQEIDFERAQNYVRSTESKDRSLAEQIADAEEGIARANQQFVEAGEEIMKIDGDIAANRPLMEAVHDMARVIRAQHAKVATFSQDILRRMVNSPGTDPEILGYTETIAVACLGELPSTTEDVLQAIWNLTQTIRDLDIDTSELRRLAKQRETLYNEYVALRDLFCERARKKEIRGLNELEITAIAEATTIEQLAGIQETQHVIQVQIAEIGTNLAKIKDAMEANKKASIDNLASFAREAEFSLGIMDRVMKKTPTARFHIEAPVAEGAEIERIITELLAQIEDRERTVRDRGVVLLNEEIERNIADNRKLIHDVIYRRIFSGQDEKHNPIVPRVYFTHESIRGKDKVPYTDQKLSTGQRTALAMMWLIKQADFAIFRAAMLHSTKREQRAALKGAQRIMFFDGLFSNLSNEDYINDAFKGLSGVGENFQLIGLIHNPYYVNNKDIFPVHLVARKKVANKDDPDRRRVFVSVEPWQASNAIVLYTSAYRHARGAPNA